MLSLWYLAHNLTSHGVDVNLTFPKCLLSSEHPAEILKQGSKEEWKEFYRSLTFSYVSPWYLFNLADRIVC